MTADIVKRDIDTEGEGTETNLEDDDEEDEEDDSGNEEFLSEELNLPETEEDEAETDSVPEYPVIMDDSEEDRIFKRQLSYPPIPMYHPPRVGIGQHAPQQHPHQVTGSRGGGGGRPVNPRDKIGMLTPMEEVTEPPSSAATSVDRSGSRNNRRAGSRSKSNHFGGHGHLHDLGPPHPSLFPQPPMISSMEQKSILKSRENLQDLGASRRVTFERGTTGNSSLIGGVASPRQGSDSPTESLVSNTSEYSSMADSGRRPDQSVHAKHEIERTITEETEETEDPDNDNNNLPPTPYHPPPASQAQHQHHPPNKNKPMPNGKGLPTQGKNSTDLGFISDMEQGEKVIQWQMENAKSVSGSENNSGEDNNPAASSSSSAPSPLDTEFPSIVNGIIAELHNLDELIGSSYHRGAMEMNASKQDHLANVSTQLATYLAQVSAQTVLSNMAQVIPLVTSLLYLTGSNFRSQLASLTAVNVFIERLRDCKQKSGMRVIPNADLTWLVRALCEIASESSRSVLKNEGALALARLIKAAGPEMVFDPFLFILMGNDEKIRKKRRDGEDDDDRIVIPTGGPGGAPKIKAIALDSLTFALLTFPRDDFNLGLVAKLACHCLLHPKRRMRQASLECLAVVSHALGSHIALPMFRQVIVEEQAQARRDLEVQESNGSLSSDASASLPGTGSGSSEAEPEAEPEPPPKQPPAVPSKIPVPLSRSPDKSDDSANLLLISPQKLKPTGSPISAVSARISRHLLPTPSLNDLVEYAVRIPASSKLLSRQNLAVSRQEELDSGESGGSANVGTGRRAASSSGTSCSSVTNVEIELEPVLNALGSGRRKQINEVAGSVMAADVAWILGGSGPIKACDGTSVLAPIYRQQEKQLLISDMNLTSTHLRQLGMVHSAGLDESDSNVSESFIQQLEKMRRGSLRPNGNPVSNTLGQVVPNSKNPQNNDGTNGQLKSTDPNMSRYYYGNNGSGGLGRGGMGMSNGGGVGSPPDNNNGGRLSSSNSYSLLPNKYSITSNGLGGRGGGVGGGGSANGNSLQLGVGGDPMMSPHHVPNASYDYYGSSLEGLDGYGSGGALNSASDMYNEPPASLRAPSRAKLGGQGQMQSSSVHSIRQKYSFDPGRGGLIKGNYSDDEDEDVGIANNGSESSAASSDEEEDMNQAALRQQEALMKERRASQTSVKAPQPQPPRKSGKNPKKSGKGKSKKGSKEGKNSPPTSNNGSLESGSGSNNGGGQSPDKVEQIVNRLQQEYQVYRVDHVELDQPPSQEELAAAKKKRGELDSAGSNSRDSGVSIGAGSVASAVHTPQGDPSLSQQQPSISPEEEDSPTSAHPTSEPLPMPSNNNNSSNGSNNSGSSSGKKEGNSKRKSSLKTGKKVSGGAPKVVQHAIDGEDSLSRNWKSTPDVASIMDEYEPRMSSYRRLSTERGLNGIGGGGGEDDLLSHSRALAAAGDNTYVTLHRKPVLAGRRQSVGLGGRPMAVDLGELEERQLALIPQEEGGRASRLEYHNRHPKHNPSQHNPYSNPIHAIASHNLTQGGFGGGGYPAAGLHAHLHSPEPNFHRHSSMLEIDKASPSRESSAGSGNTYLLNQDGPLHHQQHHLHPNQLSSHNLRSSKSTGNLIGIGMEDQYRQPMRGGGGVGMGMGNGMGNGIGMPGPGGGNSYYEIMDHPTSPGRRMMHSRAANHILDLGNSTDDMEFPMTPQSESSSNTLPKQSRGMMGGRMNGKIVPKKIYKGSFREVNSRHKTGGMSLTTELFPDDLKPVTSPKHALPAALLQVQAADWETNVDGFRQLVRLARHHPEFIRSDLHNVNMNALRHVMNLRTQVCRSAVLFFRELFMNLGKAMEHDAERIAEKLLDKAADTNKFIREDSGKSLEALVLNVSPAKALTCLDLYGTRHRNPAVRCMTARMTTKLIEKMGADRCLSEVPERLLPMLCRFLQEGSLDTRMSAKLAFSVLMENPSFDTQLKRHVSADTLRHVQKAMKAITTKS